MKCSHHRTCYWPYSMAVFIFPSVKLTFSWPSSLLQLTALSYLSNVSRNLKFSQRYCEILSFVPTRQLGKHFIISWTLIGLITVTLYNRQYISTQVWVMDPIALPSILQCWLNAAKGQRSSSSTLTCSVSVVFSLCRVCSHAEPKSAAHQSKCETLGSPRVLWPLSPAVSLGDMGKCADDLPYYIYHCHMFIYGSGSYEPAEGWAISPVPLLAAPPLWLFITSLSASWLFSSSHRAVFVFHPLVLSVLVISLTSRSHPLHPRHHWLPTTSLPLSLPKGGGGGAALEWLILPQTELNMEEREMGGKLWLTLWNFWWMRDQLAGASSHRSDCHWDVRWDRDMQDMQDMPLIEEHENVPVLLCINSNSIKTIKGPEHTFVLHELHASLRTVAQLVSRRAASL